MADNDRVFDEGCVLCGSERAWPIETIGLKHTGHLLCNGCHGAFGASVMKCDAEITRRKNLRRAGTPAGEAKGEPPASWRGFKVGDRVCLSGCVDQLVYLIVRPADDGTDWALISREDGSRNGSRNDGHFYGEPRRFERAASSPPPASSAEAPAGSLRDAQPAGGGSSKVDPYTAHRERETYLFDHDIEFRRWHREQSNLAATRRAHLDQARAELDRKVTRGRHDWDPDDGAESELRCT